MKMLQHPNPEVSYASSNDGIFVASRISNSFLSRGIDQCRNQFDKIAKGDAAAVGLTEDEEKLWKWTVRSLDVARVTIEFEQDSALKETKKSDSGHHEQTVAFQKHCLTLATLTRWNSL